MKVSDRVLFALSPLASAALAFFAVPLMTWTMPSQAIAQFGLFQYASTLMLLLITCGLDQAFLREMASTKSTGALLRRALLPCAAIWLCTALILVFSGSTLATRVFHETSGWLISLLLVNVGLLAVHRFGAQYARMNSQGAIYLAAEIALRLPLLICLIATAFSSSPDDDTAPLLWLVVGTFVAACSLIFRNTPLWTRVFRESADDSVPTTKSLLKFGAPLAIAGVLYWGMGNVGAYAIQLTHGAADTARFVVAGSIANVATIGQTVFSLLWLPLIYKRIDAGLDSEYIALSARKICLAAVVVFVFASLGIHCMQYLLGVKYRNVAPLATALCVLPALYTISEVTFIGLMVTRRGITAMCATCLAFVVSAIANLLLTARFGVIGATVSVGISAFVFFATRTELAGMVWERIPRKSVYFGAISIAVTGMTSSMLPNGWSIAALLLTIPYILSEFRIISEMLRWAFERLGSHQTSM